MHIWFQEAEFPVGVSAGLEESAASVMLVRNEKRGDKFEAEFYLVIQWPIRIRSILQLQLVQHSWRKNDTGLVGVNSGKSLSRTFEVCIYVHRSTQDSLGLIHFNDWLNKQ